MRESNYCMFFMEASRSKVLYIIYQIIFYVFPAMFMFCKVNIFLFSTRLNMITASVGQWLVGRWLVGWWSVDLIKAHQWRFSVQSLSSDHFLFKKFCAERKSTLTYNYSSLFFVHLCGSVRKWSVVGWSVVGGLVVGGFNKSPSVKVFSAEPFEWPFFIQEILCREKVDINL